MGLRGGKARDQEICFKGSRPCYCFTEPPGTAPLHSVGRFPTLNNEEVRFSDLWGSLGLTSLNSVILIIWDHSKDSRDSWDYGGVVLVAYMPLGHTGGDRTGRRWGQAQCASGVVLLRAQRRKGTPRACSRTPGSTHLRLWCLHGHAGGVGGTSMSRLPFLREPQGGSPAPPPAASIPAHPPRQAPLARRGSQAPASVILQSRGSVLAQRGPLAEPRLLCCGQDLGYI